MRGVEIHPPPTHTPIFPLHDQNGNDFPRKVVQKKFFFTQNPLKEDEKSDC